MGDSRGDRLTTCRGGRVLIDRAEFFHDLMDIIVADAHSQGVECHLRQFVGFAAQHEAGAHLVIFVLVGLQHTSACDIAADQHGVGHQQDIGITGL